MDEHDNLEGIRGTINESPQLILGISYQAHFVSWQESKSKLHLRIQLYKNSHCPWQWEEPSTRSYPQSNITSGEHLAILLRFRCNYIQHYFHKSLTCIFAFCVHLNWGNLDTHINRLSQRSDIKYNSSISGMQHTSPESFHTMRLHSASDTRCSGTLTIGLFPVEEFIKERFLDRRGRVVSSF